MIDAPTDVIVQIAGEDVVAGRLWSHRGRRSESATFAYTSDYLLRSDAYELDPVLPLTAGQHHAAAGRAMFGAFSDCAPDRWGRRLILRAERRRAEHDAVAERRFGEIDVLLGVRDDLRQGALRFRDPARGTFLADERSGVPHLVDLPKLLGAAEHLERDAASDAELQTLLRGGSSLGGARPKAHVRDRSGRLGIAKFPSAASDAWDVIRWEAVALRLAREAGIAVPDWTLQTVDGKGVLIVERFDHRRGRRLGFASAMTMLEATDGDQGSYLDIAEVVERLAVGPVDDLHELWRRMAFSILISNTDDHLRNHGFLREDAAGWSLSPAFDLNPDPQPGPVHLSTAIDYETTAARLDVLMDVAEHFRLSADDARAVLGDVLSATRRWRSAAHACGLPRGAAEQMAAAFEHPQAELAREIVGH